MTRALVTGASGGIGSAICRRLAADGLDVIVHANRNAEKAEVLAAEIRDAGGSAEVAVFDVTDAQRTRQYLEALSAHEAVQIVVNNAGVHSDAPMPGMSREQWDEVIDVNLKGYFNYNKAAAVVFKDQKGGKIVNISSINGMRGRFAQSNYTASKGGEIAMSKSLARELGKFNVNVNVVAPGLIWTDMAHGMPPEARNRSQNETALGRLGTPEECADVVAFLCSDRARHITGEIVKVDGGQYM